MYQHPFDDPDGHIWANGKVSVTDGPFAETKEYLAGFYLIEARDLNEAIPASVGSIEVRPIRPIRGGALR
jgi:hypothetical protein